MTFIHGSFLYDLMAVLHGQVFLLHGFFGHGWDPSDYVNLYMAQRDTYLLVGRLIVVVSAVALLLAINRLAEMLYGGYAGVLATALLVLGVYLPLTGTSLKEDVPASALLALCLIILWDDSLRLPQSVRWSLAGVLGGAAISARYTVAPLMLIPFLMTLTMRMETGAKVLAVFVCSAAATFLAIEPYILLDRSDVGDASLTILSHFKSAGVAHHALPRYLWDYLPLGMGILLSCCAIPAACRALISKDVRLRALVCYVAIISATFMWATTGVPRYVVILAPFLCILVAGELLRWQSLAATGRGWVVIGLALLLTWPANIISLKFILLLSRPDTRALTQAWIESQVPASSKILLEGMIGMEPTFAPALVPTREWFEAKQEEARKGGTTGTILKAAASRADLSDRPRYELVEKALEDVQDLTGVDYLILSSYQSLPREWMRVVTAQDPDVQALLLARQAAIERIEKDSVQVFSAIPVPNLRFDWVDNLDFRTLWSAPLWSYENWIVGPKLKVYRRTVKQVVEK